MKICRVAVPALLVAALFLGACKSDSKKEETKAPATPTSTTMPPAKPGSMGVMNSKCPMSGEAVDKDDPSEAYKDGKIAFCCKNCEAKFNALSDADKAAKVAAAK
jgi:hypothetical protein